MARWIVQFNGIIIVLELQHCINFVTCQHRAQVLPTSVPHVSKQYNDAPDADASLTLAVLRQVLVMIH